MATCLTHPQSCPAPRAVVAPARGDKKVIATKLWETVTWFNVKNENGFINGQHRKGICMPDCPKEGPQERTIRRDEMPPFVTTWMDFENLMLSKISQTEKSRTI